MDSIRLFLVTFHMDGRIQMNLNHIIELLSTITQYNNVNITQTFSLEGKDIITVRCIPETTMIELRYLQSLDIEHFDTVEEAAAVINLQLNPNNSSNS